MIQAACTDEHECEHEPQDPSNPADGNAAPPPRSRRGNSPRPPLPGSSWGRRSRGRNVSGLEPLDASFVVKTGLNGIPPRPAAWHCDVQAAAAVLHGGGLQALTDDLHEWGAIIDSSNGEHTVAAHATATAGHMTSDGTCIPKPLSPRSPRSPGIQRRALLPGLRKQQSPTMEEKMQPLITAGAAPAFATAADAATPATQAAVSTLAIAAAAAAETAAHAQLQAPTEIKGVTSSSNSSAPPSTSPPCASKTQTKQTKQRGRKGHRRNQSISSWPLPAAIATPAMLEPLIELAPTHVYGMEERSQMQALLRATPAPAPAPAPAPPIKATAAASDAGYHSFVVVQLIHLPAAVSTSLRAPTAPTALKKDATAGFKGASVEIAACVDCTSCFMVRSGGGFYLCGPVDATDSGGRCNCTSCGAVLDIDICTQTNLTRGAMAHLAHTQSGTPSPRPATVAKVLPPAGSTPTVSSTTTTKAIAERFVRGELAAAEARLAAAPETVTAAASNAADNAATTTAAAQPAIAAGTAKELAQKEAAGHLEFEALLLAAGGQQKAKDLSHEDIAEKGPDLFTLTAAPEQPKLKSRLESRLTSRRGTNTIRRHVLVAHSENILDEVLTELTTSMARRVLDSIRLDIASATVLALLMEEVVDEMTVVCARSVRLAAKFKAMPRPVAGGTAAACTTGGGSVPWGSTHAAAGDSTSDAGAASKLQRRRSSQVLEYLYAFELIPQHQLSSYKQIFSAIDADGDGMLTSEELRVAIAAALHSLSLEEAVALAAATAAARSAEDTSGSHVDRMLSGLTGEVLDAVQEVAEVQPDLNPTNFQLFAIIAAMVEKIASPRTAGIHPSDRSGWWKLSANATPLIHQLQRARNLYFLCNVDSFGTIDVDEIAHKLSAAGQPSAAAEFEEMLEDMTSRHGGWGRLSFLDFLDYLPFFSQLHVDIISIPFSSCNGDERWNF